MKFIKTNKGYLDITAVKSFWMPDSRLVYADAIPIKAFDTEFEAVDFLDKLVHALNRCDYDDFVAEFNAAELANRPPPSKCKVSFHH